MKVFTLRDLLRKPSEVLEAAKEDDCVVITTRDRGTFTIKPSQIEIEVTRTIKK